MTVQDANSAHDGFGFGIIEMPEVPGQEIIDSMHGGYGNMKGVVQGIGWKRSSLKKRFGQPNYCLCDRQYGNTG